ncbi:hypothetical protein QVD17_11989 [Tagetes erecta]|uniref:Uncharacterized protein n=1 Tax=Tagetes erecta TaxID=13708 RepID=A0AAD8KZ26_TARER|nr:hypothetical protein QVD17_11989 [Tagetes erecta]
MERTTNLKSNGFSAVILSLISSQFPVCVLLWLLGFRISDLPLSDCSYGLLSREAFGALIMKDVGEPPPLLSWIGVLKEAFIRVAYLKTTLASYLEMEQVDAKKLQEKMKAWCNVCLRLSLNPDLCNNSGSSFVVVAYIPDSLIDLMF